MVGISTNASSVTYHKDLNCSHYQRIPEENKKEVSEDRARNEFGLRPCGNCTQVAIALRKEQFPKQ